MPAVRAGGDARPHLVAMRSLKFCEGNLWGYAPWLPAQNLSISSCPWPTRHGTDLDTYGTYGLRSGASMAVRRKVNCQLKASA